jgi:hypothetical protein
MDHKIKKKRLVIFVELMLRGDVLCLLDTLGEELTALVLSFVDETVYLGLVPHEQGKHNLVVDDGGAVVGDRSHAPDHEHGLINKAKDKGSEFLSKGIEKAKDVAAEHQLNKND